VNNQALIAALRSGHVASYVTDFPDNELVGEPNVIGTPHLAASTPESENNCAVMAAQEISEYLENGNIYNSVNMPAVSMPRSGVCRVCVIHKNVPAMLNSILNLFSASQINIENLINKSRKDMAYTMIDLNTKVGESFMAQIEQLPSVIRVRVL
jgi:D-3-phosphoglycerate dehydrogenase